MRIAFLLLLACLAALAVLGQECAPKPPEPQPPSAQIAPAPVEQPAPSAQRAQPAPTPGHPLDPNDVAILTGHAVGSNAAHSPYMTPTILYDYTGPYSYGSTNRYWFGPGHRFGFNGFFFPRPGRFGAPVFGGPSGLFFFSGLAAGPH